MLCRLERDREIASAFLDCCMYSLAPVASTFQAPSVKRALQLLASLRHDDDLNNLGLHPTDVDDADVHLLAYRLPIDELCQLKPNFERHRHRC